jgi:hypothetical protein
MTRSSPRCSRGREASVSGGGERFCSALRGMAGPRLPRIRIYEGPVDRVDRICPSPEGPPVDFGAVDTVVSGDRQRV